MNKLLEALADLLNVSTKTVEQVIDTSNLVIPDLLEKLARELPLFRLFDTLGTFLFLCMVVFIVATVIVTIANFADYQFEDARINKMHKITALITVSTIFLYFGVQFLKATVTPTVYSIEYAVELIGDTND